MDTLTFREGLVRARSHLVTLAGLAAAFGLIFALEAWDPAPPDAGPRLTPDEHARAAALWAPLDARPPAAADSTGRLAAYVHALVAAREIGLVDRAGYEARLARVLPLADTAAGTGEARALGALARALDPPPAR